MLEKNVYLVEEKDVVTVCTFYPATLKLTNPAHQHTPPPPLMNEDFFLSHEGGKEQGDE